MPATTNRRFILRERPSGDFDPEILERVVGPGPGQALARTPCLLRDPSVGKRIVEVDGRAGG